MDLDIKQIMADMPEKRASDLHIGADAPLHYRIDNDLVPVTEQVLSAEEAKEIIYSLLTEEQINRLETEKEIDFSIAMGDVGRYRCNAFTQRNATGCAIRLIPLDIMTIAECGLPADVVQKFCYTHRGLVLVTGATGSGKSTTLAAMVDEINANRTCHIVTIEDPIEFVHKNKKSIIDQRQLFQDTYSFGSALRHVLRQDPDVILIGELRDLDTIQAALVIADTGHLVLGTLHTSDSIQTINRIVDVFPSHQQKQIRVQLSFVLIAILSQQLIPRAGKKGRVLAAEVLVATPAVRSMIRENKEHQIYSIIQTSQKYGMKTMNQSLVDLVFQGEITHDEALARSPNTEELIKMLG
ncbi:MAG: type IV pilus twitching motility protein PilT [Candidatus Omnitrophica bacterium]|nr:type IV pilus twitching motility protein PilT [Candidatus Omnitrophota bacterium]MDD5488374.1 type IV pilus twitching motility protein PilT [Candidatus Omnitrophota bacterium]